MNPTCQYGCDDEQTAASAEHMQVDLVVRSLPVASLQCSISFLFPACM